MKRFLTILTVIFILAIAAQAQAVQVTGGGYSHDTVKITAVFQNLNVANQNLPGGNLSVDYKLTDFGRWRLGAVASGAYQHDTDKNLDRYQFLGGPQLSYRASERVSVFGRGMFGATRFDSRRGNVRDFTRGTVSYGGGLDVHFGRFRIRPFQLDVQYIDNRPVRYTQAGAGVGWDVF